MRKLKLILAASLLAGALPAHAADYSLHKLYANPAFDEDQPELCEEANFVEGKWRLSKCRPYPKELITVPENLYVIQTTEDITIEPDTERTKLSNFFTDNEGKVFQGVSCELKHNKVGLPRKIEKGSQLSIVSVAPFERSLALEEHWRSEVKGTFGIKSPTTGVVYKLSCGFFPRVLPGIDEFFMALNEENSSTKPIRGIIRF